MSISIDDEGGIIADSRYTRFKGADWFISSYNLPVMILGQGGIGSWLTLFMARVGCNITTYDMDIFEEHNMSGQFVSSDAIDKNKAEAVAELVEMLSPDSKITPINEMYTETSPTNDIVICGFDNMAARKAAFIRWVDYVNHHAPDKSKCFFQDGRLLAEHFQIFNICGDDADGIATYFNEYLFDDSEVEPVDCTFKQTSHCAAMIASHMTGFFTNWVSKKINGNVRALPYKYQFTIPLNLVQK